MARVFPLLLLLLFLVAIVSAVDAQTTKSREPAGRPTDARPASTDTDDPGAGKSSPRRQPGRLSVDNGSANGRYVSFAVDPTTCSIREFSIYGQPLFSNVQIPGDECRIGRGGAQNRFELRSDEAELQVHDAPNALLQFRSDDQSARFTLDAFVNGTKDGDEIALNVGNLTGRVFTRNGTLVFADGMVAGDRGTIMFRPASGTSPERRAIFDAVRAGKVGAETDLLVENGSLVPEVATFDNVSLAVARPELERFDFTVDGHVSGGRVFVVHVDPATWDPTRVRIDYADVEGDGEQRSVLIRQADSLQEVLDFDPGNGPVSFVFEDEEGWHAAVAVPAFSVHVFQMVGLPLQVVPLLLYGVVLTGLVFAGGGVGVVLERRARNR